MSLLRQAICSCAPSIYASRHGFYLAQAALSHSSSSNDAQTTGGSSRILDASEVFSADSMDSDGTKTPPKRRRRTAKTVTEEAEGTVKRKSKTKKRATDQEEDQTRKDPLEPGQTELWLQSLQNSGLVPSLREDLDKLRRKPPKIGSPNYGTQYDDLLDTITRTFSAAQLSSFCQQLGFPYYRRRKMELAESILNHWNWRPPREVERRIREETEILPRSACYNVLIDHGTENFAAFPFEQYHLFLVMGKGESRFLDRFFRVVLMTALRIDRRQRSLANVQTA